MKNKIQIIPAVMPQDYDDLVEKIGFVYHHVDSVQIDVMDGKFVPSISWPYSDDSHFENMMKQDEGLPHWEDLDFSVDLMVSNPKEEVQKWIDVGVAEVIIHIESLNGDIEFVRELKERDVVSICLAIGVDTPNEELEKYEGLYDSVQFMGIKKVGYQGEPFVDEVLNKLSVFSEQYPSIPIMVDGAVNEETIKILVDAGATRLAVGSAIFNAIDAKGAIRELVESSK